MLNTQKIEEKSGSSREVIARYFVLSILAVVLASACAVLMHPLRSQGVQVSGSLVGELLDYVLSVVPANVVDPFVESNTSQLLFMAFSLGYMLIKLGDGVHGLRHLVREANIVGLQLAGWVSKLVPWFVGLFLCLEITIGRVTILAGLWRPLVLSVAVALAVLLAVTALPALQTGVPMHLLLRKIRSPFVVALKTGSLDEAFDDLQSSCVKLLGVDRGYAKEALPQGLVLYMPASAIGTMVFTVYTAQAFNIEADAVWYLSAVVMAVVVFVATPPVPGANLLAYVVLFSMLGIPAEALLDAMVFDVVFGIVAGAVNQAMLQMELLLQANRYGLLNRELLGRTSL